MKRAYILRRADAPRDAPPLAEFATRRAALRAIRAREVAGVGDWAALELRCCHGDPAGQGVEYRVAVGDNLLIRAEQAGRLGEGEAALLGLAALCALCALLVALNGLSGGWGWGHTEATSVLGAMALACLGLLWATRNEVI